MYAGCFLRNRNRKRASISASLKPIFRQRRKHGLALSKRGSSYKDIAFRHYKKGRFDRENATQPTRPFLSAALSTSKMLRSRVVLACAFVTLLVGYVHSTPSCHLRERPLDHLYVCTGFTSPSDFEELIQRPLFYPNTTFVLRNSTLDHLPEGAFARLSIRDLELRNVQVTSFSGHDTAPFSGLETSLKKISFTEDSSLPESWGVLKNLRNLTALGLARMTRLNLTRDFKNLPSNVRTIAVVSSTIESVDPNWLSNMDKLGAVVLRSSNFGQVTRAMFPTTAPNMWRIDLFATGLTSIPTGFNEGMPSLKYLDLGDNNITTIDEASATALFDIGLTKLTLFDNPLHCDCSLSFIVNHPDPPVRGNCVTPTSLKHRGLTTLTIEELCGSA